MAKFVSIVKVVHQIEIHTGLFESGEVLRFDGSNFVSWFKRLCDMLKCNDLIHLIREPLGEEPDESEDREDFIDRRACAVCIRDVMRRRMDPKIQLRFDDQIYPDSMVQDLKELFTEPLSLGQFEILRKFLSTKMGEKDYLQMHLWIMQDLYDFLTIDLQYWVVDEMAVNVLLQSLSAKYEDIVEGYVRRNERTCFNKVKDQLWDLEN